MTYDGHEADAIELTDRQRQVWDMSYGVGSREGQGKMKAPDIAQELGISANAVYVHRRRIKTIIEQRNGGDLSPKRIIRQESRLEMAIAALEAEMQGMDDEEETLQARLDQIHRQRPEVEKVLDSLRSVATPTEEESTQDGAGDPNQDGHAEEAAIR